MSAIRYRTCPLCEANCGLAVEVDGGVIGRVTGDVDNPLSRGYICPKAVALADVQNDPDRLRTPRRRVGGDWVEIGWEQAFEEIAAKVAAIQADQGVVTTYIGNPAAHNYSGLTQIPVLKGALGGPPTYSAATMDNMPNMLIQLMMFGHNFLYPIPDIDRSDFMLVIGANPAASNGSLWTAPNVRGRIAALRARGGRLVTVDPRRTETAQLADEHVFVRPGCDAAFLIALLLALEEAGLVRPGRLEPMLAGWAEAWAALEGFDIDDLAEACGVPAADVRRLARDYGEAPAAIAYGRIGVSTQAFGGLCQWLIQLLNIATGNLDREGGMMFPNPAVDVAALTPGGSYGRFASRVRGRPETCNEFPVATLAEEILTPGEGRLRGLITYAGNPVLSTPDGRRLDRALRSLELMVSIDIYVNETTRHAHYILPPCGPLEKDHYPWYLGPMMSRDFACYSPAVLPVEPGMLSDWEILQRLGLKIAEACGREPPPARKPRAVLDGALRASSRGLTLAELEAHPHGMDLGPLQPGLPERLRTPDQRIQCAPEACLDDLQRLRAGLDTAAPGDRLMLIGRRHVRNNNSWMHNSRRLAKGPLRCTLMLHPDDAAERGLDDGDLARIVSAVGVVEAPVEITADVMPGVACLPHGFGHGREGVRLSVARDQQPGVSFNDLTDGRAIDRLSGNGAVNGTLVRVSATHGRNALERSQEAERDLVSSPI